MSFVHHRNTCIVMTDDRRTIGIVREVVEELIFGEGFIVERSMLLSWIGAGVGAGSLQSLSSKIFIPGFVQSRETGLSLIFSFVAIEIWYSLQSCRLIPSETLTVEPDIFSAETYKMEFYRKNL